MSIQQIHYKNKSEIKLNSIFSFTRMAGIFFFILTAASSAVAQEYATDRLFMKEFSKTKCRSLAEYKINSLKIIRTMTLEQQDLRQLKKKGVSSTKLSSKNIWDRKAAQFREIRLKCK